MTRKPKFRQSRGRPQWAPPPRTDRHGMWAHVANFLEALRIRHFSETTLTSHRSYLGRFLKWCDERSILEPTEVTQPIVEQYQSWLYYHRKTNGRPLSVTFQNSLLRSVKVFFRWLTRQHLTLFNPAAEIELSRPSHFVPRDVLTAAEAECVLQQPDVTTPVGIRDRAILETLYSTGIRRMELASLELNDIDDEQRTLMVRQGKYRKDRVLPIGQRARTWIETYVSQARPRFTFDRDERHLFLTEDGNPFVASSYRSASTKPTYLSAIVRTYMIQAKIGKPGGCHVFRHTMATLMLENGADLRYVQEMLGHSDPSTTQRYTHVSIRKLQQIHQATHPAEQANARSGPEAAPAAPQLGDAQVLTDDERDDEPDTPSPPADAAATHSSSATRADRFRYRGRARTS